MSWIKISDTVANHPKFIGLSDSAFSMWVKGLGYAKHYLTDGAIPAGALRSLTTHAKPANVAEELIAARLWELVSNVYQIHDYLDENDSREEVERKIDEARQRKERWRNKSSGHYGTPQERVPERVPNAEGTHVSCPPETETETETETDTKREPAKAGPQVSEVFEAYLAGWRQHVNRGAVPVLTTKREKVIKARLKEHPLEVVTKAAGGIWASSWHRENAQTSIDLAMRDAAHVERFAGDTDRSSSPARNTQLAAPTPIRDQRIIIDEDGVPAWDWDAHGPPPEGLPPGTRHRNHPSTKPRSA